MDDTRVQILDEADREALEAFLRPRRSSSLFLLSNMAKAGLQDQGRRFQGTYVAVLAETGEIVGVAAHYWNGNVIFQAPPEMVPRLLRTAVIASPRKLKGLIGPDEQVEAARAALDLPPTALQLDSPEKLYRLALAALRVPEALADGRVAARHMEAEDLALVTAWRAAFSVETLGEKEGEDLRRRSRASSESALQEGRTWILEAEGRPVAMTSFNATTEEMVQVGGVWTPPEQRSRGYGRAVVAASLLEAREAGAEEAILFTDDENVAAQRAYEALGFAAIGDYRLLFVKEALGLEEIV